MKKYIKNAITTICVLMLLCTLVLPASAVYAQTGTGYKSQTVRVGYYPLDGYYEKSKDGTLSGYGYKFLQMIAAYSNFKYEYVGYDKSWSELLEMLDDGKLDMLTSVQYTEERAAKFDYSESPVGYSEAILTTRANQDKLSPGDYESYENMRVGMMTGSSLNEKLFEFAKSHNFNFKPVYYKTQEDVDNALQDPNEVDAILNTSMNILGDEYVLDRFGKAPYYVVVKKGNSELLDKVNYALNELNNDDISWMNNLYNKYYAANDSYLVLSPQERKYLQQYKDSGNKVSVLINPDLYPYSYFEDMQAKGILVDYFNEVCKLYGFKADYIYADTARDYMKSVIDHKGSIVLVPYFLRYESDADGYNLTQSFMDATFCLVTRNGEKHAENLAGKKIAIVEGMTSVEQAGNADFKDADFIYFKTSDACIRAVKKNKADGALLYGYTAYHYLNTDWDNEIQLYEMPDTSISFAIAVSRDCDPTMFNLMNYAIHTIPSSNLESIVLSTVFSNDNTETSTFEYLKHRPALLRSILAICIALVLFILLLVNRRYARKQKAKKEEAEYEATHDALTGLYNRQGYHNLLEKFKSDAKPCAYMLLDIDDFKTLNDTYGHAFGDEVLTLVANQLLEMFRSDDYVFRIGGDEFGVILVNCKNDAWETISYKQRLMHIHINQTLNKPIYVTLSIGISWSESGFTDKMVTIADDALYSVKRSGKGGCQVYNQSSETLFEWRDEED